MARPELIGPHHFFYLRTESLSMVGDARHSSVHLVHRRDPPMIVLSPFRSRDRRPSGRRFVLVNDRVIVSAILIPSSSIFR